MEQTETKMALVTGAGSGIGEACAKRLAGMGWRVFAGVLNEEQAEHVRREQPDAVTPIVFDITDADAIASAARTITAETGDAGLHGLVNNAGIAVPGPLEYLPISGLRRQLEVNLIGQVAVTQAFLPLLRKATGRIVNIASMAGRFSAPLMGPYCMSKHGMEAFSDTLRLELSPWGMQVACIEPAVIDTPILDGELIDDPYFEKLPAQARERYDRFVKLGNAMAERMHAVAHPPDVVAKVVAHALTARRAKPRYVVGGDKWRFLFFASLPDRIRDWLLLRGSL